MPLSARSTGPIERAAEALVILGLRIAEVAMFSMVVLIAAEVFSRNVANVSLLIADEVSGYLLVAMTFCGAGYSVRSGALLRIEFVLFALPPRVRAVVDVIYDLLALAVTAALLYELTRITWSTWSRHMVAATLMETPLWIPQLAMPVGCIILMVAFLLDLRGSLARLFGRAPAEPPAPQREVLL
ncbi:MAG: TRAP transporter small permease subunit [Burkholderiales bacterium]